MSKSPLHKRLRLDPSASPSPSLEGDGVRNSSKEAEFSSLPRTRESVASVEDDEDHCVICLQRIRDRTVLPCAHDRMCFECILVWTAQSRKCPLCNAPIGPFLIHNMRSKYDYQKRYLPPLQSPPSVTPLSPLHSSETRNRNRGVISNWGTRRRTASRERQNMQDQLELAVERRKWVYRHRLYAKHVASNPYTRYRPAPTPAQIAASPDVISRATIFVRRELRVWVNLDVEFLTTFILSLMKSLDLRSESAVKLLAEFLDMDTPYYVGEPSASTGRFQNAEQFAHELYSYLRSPFRDLTAYDSAVQYDTPEHVPPAPSQLREEERRWDMRSSAQADTSTHRRRHSSASLSSRPPRDAHPHSLSHVRSRDDEERYGRPHSSRFRESGAVDRDRKGKDKEPASDRLRESNDRSRRTRAQQSRRRSRSRGRDHTQSRHHIGQTARESRYRRSISKTSERDPTDTPVDGPVPAKLMSSSSSKISTRNTSRDGQRNMGDTIPHLDTSLAKDGQSVPIDTPAPTKPETIWGISIKGQAKLLQQSQHSVEPHNNAQSSQDSHMDNAHGGMSESKTLSSGAPPPGSVSQDGADTAPATGSDGGRITHETQNGATLRGNSVSRDTFPTHPPQALQPVTQRSAPEIMARTRARLAKLRGQASVAGVAAAAPDASESSGSSTSADLGMMRTRLLERLEQEKKQATSLPSIDGDPAPGARCRSEDPNRTEPATEAKVVNLANRLDPLQTEVKLRTQALLRVRLAAEKRKFEERTD